MITQDEIDVALKGTVFEQPGICIAQLIKPFLAKKSESVLRQRVRALEIQGIIRFERTRKEVLCFPVEA